MTFGIRRANLSDLATLIQMRIALLREVGNVQNSINPSELADLMEALERYFECNLADGRYVGFLFETDGKIVGDGGLVFSERPPYYPNLAGSEAYLMNMYTVPEWRGKGVATAIVREILAFSQHSGAKRVWLHAEPAAKRIYERAGFVSKNSEMEIIF